MVPALDEAEHGEREEPRLHERQHDAPPGAQPAGTVDERGHLEVPRDVVEEAFHDPDAERERERRLHEDDPGELVVEPERAQDDEQRDEERHAREAVQQQDAAEHHAPALEAKPREGVAGHRGDEHADERGHRREDEGVDGERDDGRPVP